jgi:lambda repressor-like predicted transcriptional regulator
MRAHLRNKNSEPIDWTGASVVFQIKKAGAALIERAATILSTDGVAAYVEYAWQAGDGLVAGADIQARFVATLNNGNKMSFPKGSTIAVIVNAKLT